MREEYGKKSDFEEIQQSLMEHLNTRIECSDQEVLELIDATLLEQGSQKGLSLEERSRFRKELYHAVRRLDVLQELLEDDTVTEIMINGWKKIFIEREGKLSRYPKTFTSQGKLDDVIQQIAARCDRVINTLHPIVDARLENGARVNAVIPPASLDGPVLTIRRFPDKPITMETLAEKKSLTAQASKFLEKVVCAKYTLLVGGSTGAGKTTLVNALSAFIPSDERLITIEDNAELQIQGIPNLVRLECRAANLEETQEITVSNLLKTALRMRPTRIIVGEIRSDAADLLQAVNVGSEGSISTIHANSCKDMVSRLETLVLQDMNLPLPAIRRQIAAGFDLFVYLGRMQDSSRKLLEICELDGIVDEEVVLRPLFAYEEGRGLIQINALKHRQKLRKAGIDLEDGL